MVSLHISLANQRLTLINTGHCQKQYPVSTARNGAGNRKGSGCTPLGQHRIKLKIGAGCPLNTVFVGRRPTGEIYTTALAASDPTRDWILTRILWLTGCESGKNRGAEVDSLRRFIYIHGTPDSEPIGEPHSLGCIRMRNHDVVELFDRIENRTLVEISL